MKRIFKSYLSGIAIVIALLFTAYIALMYFGISFHSVDHFGIPEDPTAETEHLDGSVDSSMINDITFYTIPDTISIKAYKKAEDSIGYLKTRIENENEAKLKSGMSSGIVGAYIMDTLPNQITAYNPWKSDTLFSRYNDSIQFYNDIVVAAQDKDSIAKYKLRIKQLQSDYTKRKDQLQEQEKKLYYFALSGYKLKDYHTRFFISHGRYKISYVKWDSVIQSGPHAGKYGKYLSKEIPIRFSKDDKMVMIPISKATYKYLELFLNMYLIVMGFLIAYVLVGLPIQILLNISKGKAFSIKNIRLFKQMSVSLFIYSVAALMMPYILHFLFRNLIPSEFGMQGLLENIINNFYPLLIAVVLFLISKAFQKGYKIQQEQDLTI